MPKLAAATVHSSVSVIQSQVSSGLPISAGSVPGNGEKGWGKMSEIEEISSGHHAWTE